MNEIYINNHLEVGEYYHCFGKRRGEHSIHKCKQEEGHKYLAHRIWAEDDNNQALEKWRIIGPIELPKLGTIFLCNDHGGLGFVSDCTTCKANSI